VLARRDRALHVGQGDIGDRRIERLHQGGEDDANGDRRPIGALRRRGHFRYPAALAVPISAARKCGRPRTWPVSTAISTLIPARSGGRRLSLVSTRTLTGMRCTTFTQFPLVFCAGSNANCWAAAGLMLSSAPCHSTPG